MNSRKLIIPVLLLITLSYFLNSFHFRDSEVTLSPDKSIPDSYSSKLQANEHFFVQRAYPESEVDLKAYFLALKSAAHPNTLRLPPVGFDADWTQQGPGNLGARVNTIAVHPFDENIIYAGFSTGGVFKTTDGGLNWVPIFDEQPYLAIGHITIDPTFPEVIYVGTGDPNISAFPLIGNGLYRSPDGGQTWQYLGLSEQRIISKVVVSPANFNDLFVASMGLPFERNSQRGIFRSGDAGQNWEQVLYLSDSTGIIDLLINPNNPQVLYASSWDRIRNNTESIAYGYGAGVYKSEDGGSTWFPLTTGLPTGKFSRVNLAMYPSNPNHIFAIYVDTTYEVHAIYKSTDAGNNWNKITSGGPNTVLATALGGQGWYNSKIAVHPTNENILYLLGVSLWRTGSGGATWAPVTPPSTTLRPHVDNHALVFTLDQNIILGTDGGMYRQEANSDLWSDIDNIKTTQFYRTGYNPHQPSLYYGGAQDNGVSSGNASSIDDWEVLQEGDGFRTLFHPFFAKKWFIEMPFGRLLVTTNSGQDYTLATFGIPNSDPKNWDAPVIISSHFSDRMFMGTNRVFTAVSPSIFNQWTAISPRLTDTTSTVPERFKTISALAESPLVDSLIYVGTSDGRLWRTADVGANWQLIGEGLPNRYITAVHASPDLDNAVYVSYSGYRDNDNTPLIYCSFDRGESWNPISSDLPQLAINDFLIAPNNLGRVVFAATDGGVYATLNGGEQWSRLGGNMPAIPVFDLELNSEKKEIVAATFGRSIMSFSLDSIGVRIDSLISIAYSGTAKTADDRGINLVSVTYTGNNYSQTVSTDSSGDFSLTNLPYSPACSIVPSKNDDHSNGLTTFDLVLMQRHILDVNRLDSPIKILAADANRSNSVTIFDVVLLRKLILQIDTALEMSESWRFIPGDFVFDHPDDPFRDSVPELYECGNMPGSNNVLLTGIKVGDVNLSANPATFRRPEDRAIRDTLYFETPDINLKKGEVYEISIGSRERLDFLGFQSTFKFNPQQLEILGIESGVLAMEEENFGWNRLSEGILTCSWNVAEGIEISGKDPLFSFKLQALEDGPLSRCLQAGSDRIPSEAYCTDQAPSLLKLKFQADSLPEYPADRSDLKVFPNPFSNQTSIRFSLSKTAKMSIRVFDQNGYEVYVDERVYSGGEQLYSLNASHFKGAGIYFYQIRIDERWWSGKLFFQAN